MPTMYPADNVDKNGKVYPTIGEHIRQTSTENLSVDEITNAVKDNTDKSKVCDALDVTALELRTAIINLLTGKTIYFGGLDGDALSSSELAEIKAHLGIV